MSIADRIKQARKDAQLSQGALARSIGASDRTVARWENGVTAPNHRQLPLIAEATGKPAGFFVEDEVADPVRTSRDQVQSIVAACLRNAAELIDAGGLAAALTPDPAYTGPKRRATDRLRSATT